MARCSDNLIALARRERRWSQLRLFHQRRVAGEAAGVALPDDATLRITLSGWEHGHHRPGKVYQRLLCDAFQLTASDLGFASQPDTAHPAVGPEAVCVSHQLGPSFQQRGTRADERSENGCQTEKGAQSYPDHQRTGRSCAIACVGVAVGRSRTGDRLSAR
jgi:transcriptional regulator with XRE-family HTH domain